MEIACMCVGISSCHSRTARVHVGPGWFAHAREGRGVGVWDVPCIPVCGHLITHRFTIVHTCTVQCSRPPLCHAHCPLIPCCTHAFAIAFTNPQCTLAESAMHAAVLSTLNCFSTSPHPSTASTPRMWNAFTHVHHNRCVHL